MTNREEEILDADENNHAILRNKIPEMIEIIHHWMEEKMEPEVFIMAIGAELADAKKIASAIGGSVLLEYNLFSDETKKLMESSRDKKHFDRVLEAAQRLSNSLRQL